MASLSLPGVQFTPQCIDLACVFQFLGRACDGLAIKQRHCILAKGSRCLTATAIRAEGKDGKVFGNCAVAACCLRHHHGSGRRGHLLPYSDGRGTQRR